MAPKKGKKGKKGKDAGGGAVDDPEMAAQIAKQKMAVEMQHLKQRMTSLLAEQETISASTGELTDANKKTCIKHEHIRKHLEDQIEGKDDEILELRRHITSSKEQHADKVEQVVAQMRMEKRANTDRVQDLNHQIEALIAKEGRIGEFDQLATQKHAIETELADTRRQLADTRNELGAWQRQTMVMSQPLYKDSVVLMLLEAMRLYPKVEVLQLEALAALQNVVSPEKPEEIVTNCLLIREFGGIAIILNVMRDHLTKERIQSNACSLLWKLSFWDGDNVPAITSNGGLHLILAAMTAHPDYAKLQYAASGVLRAIMEPREAADAARSKSPLMRAPMAEPAALTLGCKSPSSSRFPMIDQNYAIREEKQQQLKTSPTRALPMAAPDQLSEGELVTAWARMHGHAMQLLLKCMSDHHDHEYIQTYAIGALLNIVNSSDAAMVAAGKGGVIPAVMGALRSHPENGQLQVVGLKTLSRLVQAKHNRKVIERSGLDPNDKSKPPMWKELTRTATEIHRGNPLVHASVQEMRKLLKSRQEPRHPTPVKDDHDKLPKCTTPI